jgi:hypothetical protein
MEEHRSFHERAATVNLKKGLCKTDESEIRPGGQETNEAPDDSPALKGLLNYG